MAWTLDDVEQGFLRYMQDHGHALIDGHSVLSPTDDVLFTTAGMHPLTPYLHGEPHPAGRRLCDVQRCVRTTDIDEVGDNRHLTIFEMVGNWSLGDYFKETAIPQSLGLLTEVFGIDPRSLHVTCFAGDPGEGLAADDEAPAIWAQCFADAGVDPDGHIHPLGSDDNWWSNGRTGLCGPDTEMFVYVGDEREGERPDFADTPEFVEIWNNVFMTYDRSEDGTLTHLAQRNIDTGMGAERTQLFLDGGATVWDTPELRALLDAVAHGLGLGSRDGDPGDDQRVASQRIVADHLRAALVIAAAGVHPSASRQGYVLRRLVRRAVRHAELLTGTEDRLVDRVRAVTEEVAAVQGQRWPDLTGATGDHAREVVEGETAKFAKALRRGLDQLHADAGEGKAFDGDLAFRAADTLGYPAELAAEEAGRIGMPITPGWQDRYDQLREQQRERSRA
jgi:alanyl-tRNA synthetase